MGRKNEKTEGRAMVGGGGIKGKSLFVDYI